MRSWLIVAAGCAHSATHAPIVARMERHECLEANDCPVYTVTAFGDGTIEYDGARHVAVTGHHIRRVTPATISELEREFARIDFLHLPSYPRSDCTDLAVVTLSYNGKTLHHNHGDTAAPVGLFALENLFDQRLGTAPWVGHPRYLAIPSCRR